MALRWWRSCREDPADAVAKNAERAESRVKRHTLANVQNCIALQTQEIRQATDKAMSAHDLHPVFIEATAKRRRNDDDASDCSSLGVGEHADDGGQPS